MVGNVNKIEMKMCPISVEILTKNFGNARLKSDEVHQLRQLLSDAVSSLVDFTSADGADEKCRQLCQRAGGAGEKRRQLYQLADEADEKYRQLCQLRQRADEKYRQLISDAISELVEPKKGADGAWVARGYTHVNGCRSLEMPMNRADVTVVTGVTLSSL